MIDPTDNIVQDIAQQISEPVFNGYCYLIFREVQTLINEADSYPIKSIVSSFVESSKDLLSELLEGLYLLQTPILPTYIPIHLTTDDLHNFNEVQTNLVKINPSGTSIINANSSLDIIDRVNKLIDRENSIATKKKIKLINFVPYLLLRPTLNLDPLTFQFIYKTSILYSYRTDDHKFFHPGALYSVDS